MRERRARIADLTIPTRGEARHPLATSPMRKMLRAKLWRDAVAGCGGGCWVREG